jgi:flagellin
MPTPWWGGERVPISPLQPTHASRDDDPLAGRRGLIGGSREGTAPSITGGSSTEADAGPFSESTVPSRPSGDGHAFAAILNETRDQATQVADGLDQLSVAGDALTRVQRLVGRLRDVAVVALDVNLQPQQRATLQRQIDLLLDEIDVVAADTQVDDDLVRGSISPSARRPGAASAPLAPFRAIGTALLGLTGLGVRSADQALAAAGALDLATTRLQRTGKSLSTTTDRLQDVLNGLTNPATTAAGEPALDGETAALGSAILLRGHLLTSSDEAIQAQADLDVRRARWLLDWAGR